MKSKPCMKLLSAVLFSQAYVCNMFLTEAWGKVEATKICIAYVA